jgi:uncharacterized membrane protein AbrB (regulator of aidB expression)
MILASIDPWLAFYVLVTGFIVGFILTAATIPLGILIGRLFDRGAR